MIYAYPPITAINSYQTHKDYYRVSAVRAIASGTSSTLRGAPNLPYEGSSYQQFAKSALNKPGKTLALSPIRNFADTYNELQTTLRQSLDDLNRSGPYRAKLQQAYLPVPISGLLLDTQI